MLIRFKNVFKLLRSLRVGVTYFYIMESTAQLFAAVKQLVDLSK